MVFEQKANAITINVDSSSLSKGLYLVEVDYDADGYQSGRVVAQKLVVE